MPFIGIVSEENVENCIRREILDKLNLRESNVLFIKEKSIENIKESIKSFEEVIAKMKEFVLKNRCNKKWQKLYISLGVHECNILKRELKIKEGKYGFRDKFKSFIEGRWFVIRRKLRVKFGI
mgnify:CR=1 FL=1